ncbi:MAG: glucose-6-phosphate isomerase, partial [Oscillospiraceae bacterium]|nr:glucose-6-phosphate isomerase [Oscillospiraceae bacterium]
TRNALYDTGFRTELFASFEPQLERFGAWWRQLFGESEGKQGGGILPATVSYSGDLHSMGQYVQDGRRDLFETVLSFDTAQNDASVPAPVYDDGLPTLAGRGLNEINDLVRRAVVEAHVDGGVPVAQLSVPTLDARGLGAAIYFFETVCAYSCFLRGVDPFDQPGVEAYKSRVKKFLNN